LLLGSAAVLAFGMILLSPASCRSAPVALRFPHTNHCVLENDLAICHVVA